MSTEQAEKIETLLQRLEALEQRLQRTEDELAIRNLVVRYGLAADCGDVAAALSCHLENAVYVVSAPGAGREDQNQAAPDLELHGHEAIEGMLESDLHQSLLPNCAHTVGPVTVEASGDQARATGYSRIYQAGGSGQAQLMRVAVNEWQFQRCAGHWYIRRRESRLLGEQAAQNLLRQAAWFPRSVMPVPDSR